MVEPVVRVTVGTLVGI